MPLIWHWPHFLEIIDLIARYRFNGLIVHQQNILALLARPPAYNKKPPGLKIYTTNAKLP